MPRKILTEAERDGRRKAANKRVFERYRHYAGGERGSPDQWARAAEDVLHVKAWRETDPLLAVLGLSEMPDTIEELKAARRTALLRGGHQDKGGTKEQSIAINEAFDKLAEQIR